MSIAPRFGLTLFFFLSTLILCGHAHGCFINFLSSPTSSDQVSDGVSDSRDHPKSALLLHRPSDQFSESMCEQTYGFLPCSTTLLGNLFLIIVNLFLMYKAAIYLSQGSELLHEILGPGIVGGVFLPVPRALPDAMLILGTDFSVWLTRKWAEGFAFSLVAGNRKGEKKVILVSISSQPHPVVNWIIKTMAFCFVPTKTGHVKSDFVLWNP